MEPDAPLPVPPVAPVLALRYRADGTDFFGLILKNILLTLLTLGLYAPWAKTARRKFIWANIECDGQRLGYTGTGRELLFGYAKAGLIYVVLIALPALLVKLVPTKGGILQIAGFIVLTCLVPFAIYWSRRYILSRTTYRGIRFGLTGSAVPYAKTFVTGYVLSIATLGLYVPVMTNRLRRHMINNTRFGTMPLSYDGADGTAFGISLKGVFLSVLSLGIYFPWFMAALTRFRLEHTRIGDARGHFALTGRDLMTIYLLNVFGTTLSLGVAFPWIATYTLQRLCAGISVVGAVNFSLAVQRLDTGSAAGQGLADVMGTDLGL